MQADALRLKMFKPPREAPDVPSVNPVDRTARQAFAFAGLHIADADEKDTIPAQRDEAGTVAHSVCQQSPTTIARP